MPPVPALVLPWLLLALPHAGLVPGAVASDSARPASLASAPLPSAVAWRVAQDTVAQDTVARPRRRAVTYSDGYATRVQLHRVLSWGMLPLFALSYASGDQLISKGGDAPRWARRIHGPAAAGTAVLFGANAVTGTWNLWEGRQDPNGRTRRVLHSVSFLAASAGFTYAGTVLADEARRSPEARARHRNMAVGSMALSTISWLVMLVGN